MKMSISTDAYLFYGVNLDEDLRPWQENDDGDYNMWMEQFNEVNSTSLELVQHCHCDYPMFAIATEVFIAYRGDYTEITSIEINQDWNKELEKFCKDFDIEFKPGWFLVSNWC